MDGYTFCFHSEDVNPIVFHPSSKLRKEAGDREAPGGCSSLSILPCAFVYDLYPNKADCPPS